MKKVTAITVFQTAAGQRLSIVYAEINEEGKITQDNVRVDRILVDKDAQAAAEKLTAHAQNIIDEMEE